MMRWMWTGLTVLGVVATAPVSIAGQTELGLRGGYASTTLTVEDLASLDRRSGFSMVGYVRLSIGTAFDVEAGAGYTQKGVTAFDSGTEIDLALEYLELPILGTFMLPAIGRVSPRLSIGPVLAMDVGCRARMTQLELVVTVDCDDPRLAGELDRDSVDIGAQLGAGVSIRAGSRTRFSLDAMYNVGITAIGLDNDTDPNRNRAFVVAAGLWYQIAR